MSRPLTLPIPIVLFAYARPQMLQHTLECLRTNQVPLIYAFSDGTRTPDKEQAVQEVRQALRAVGWCDMRLTERDRNYGLGVSIRAGVAEVLKRHESVIVFEDDLICVPGTYAYLAAALNHYRDDPRVMSVTGWTHPRVVPSSVQEQPYFDGRAECLAWGTWAGVWLGMDRDAKTLLRACRRRGIDVYRYGADLVHQAEEERQRNIWAVRFLYLHILERGLCLRPPHSLVEHIGVDSNATNAAGVWSAWTNPPLQPAPAIPATWPVPAENEECSRLWQMAYGRKPSIFRRGARYARRQLVALRQQIAGARR